MAFQQGKSFTVVAEDIPIRISGENMARMIPRFPYKMCSHNANSKGHPSQNRTAAQCPWLTWPPLRLQMFLRSVQRASQHWHESLCFHTSRQVFRFYITLARTHQYACLCGAWYWCTINGFGSSSSVSFGCYRNYICRRTWGWCGNVHAAHSSEWHMYAAS